MPELNFGILPQIAQERTISWLAPAIWADERIVALWLGGSLARGEGDAPSDLRVAVDPDDLERWRAMDTQALTGEQVDGGRTFSLGEDALIHQLLLNGDKVDLLTQTTRDRRTSSRCSYLAAGTRRPPRRYLHRISPRRSHTTRRRRRARELIAAFRVNSHQRRKVLRRRLDLMIPSGPYHSWLMLTRLWYIQATGEDTSAHHFSGIHGLNKLVRGVEGREGVDARAAARVAPGVAQRYGFEYPLELERMVRAQWKAFRESE
jgi:hypothetical protein